MIYSNVKVYQKTKIDRSKNFIVENINDYFHGFTPIYSSATFQFIKHGLNIDIVIPLSEATEGNEVLPDYVAIKNSNETMTFYYFVKDIESCGTTSLRLFLELDTLNSFEGKYRFSDKTFIQREHIDRYFIRTRPTAYPIVQGVNSIFDKTNEDVTPTLIQKSVTDIEEDGLGGYNKWYLIYRTNASGSPEVGIVANEQIKIANSGTVYWNGLQSFMVDNYGYYFKNVSFSIKTSTTPSPDPEFSNVTLILFVNINNYIDAYILREDGTKTNYSWYRGQSDYGITFTEGGIGFQCATTNYYQFDESRYTGSPVSINVSPSGKYLSPIKNIDRSLSSIVKIIECPYCPMKISGSYGGLYSFPYDFSFSDDNGYNCMATSDLTRKFERNNFASIDLQDYLRVTLSALNRDSFIDSDPLPDPKKWTSPFHRLSLVYDSFVKSINLEEFRINPDYILSYYTLDLDYKQSEACSSNCAFYFEPKDNVIEYNEYSDFSHYIVASRQNELALFSSDYLNYLRNGYNYEKKKLTQDITSTGLTTALSTFATILGFATGNPLVAGAGIAGIATTGINATKSAVQGVQALEQKISELKKESYSVSSIDDLPLFQWYSGNNLKLIKYGLTAQDESLVDNLFYLYGYKRGVYGIPTHDNRLFFDYLQCSPVLLPTLSKSILTNDYLSDLKAKFEEGVTYIHCYAKSEEQEDYWDMEQTSNNIELSLIPELE